MWHVKVVGKNERAHCRLLRVFLCSYDGRPRNQYSAAKRQCARSFFPTSFPCLIVFVHFSFSPLPSICLMSRYAALYRFIKFLTSCSAFQMFLRSYVFIFAG